MVLRLHNIFLRILIAIAILIAITQIVIYTIGDKLLVAEAKSISDTLEMLGIHNIRISNTIYIQTSGSYTGFRIEWHCSGLITLMLFVLLLILIPMKMLRRIILALIGIPIIYLVNILRIAIVIIVAQRLSIETATAIHIFIGPAILIGTTIMLIFIGLREELLERGYR